MTLVVGSLEEIEQYDFSPEDLYAQRCALIEGKVAHIDAHNKILLLGDERIICYTCAYLS
jgi:hypothetical protein